MRCRIRTYRLEDEKAGEEIEDRVESGGKNCSNLMVRGKCDCHHPIVCEVEEREEHDEYVPKELGHTPLQIDYGLNQTVGYFNQNLQPTHTRKDSQKQTENFYLGLYRQNMQKLELIHSMTHFRVCGERIVGECVKSQEKNNTERARHRSTWAIA
jgi:hypothetical protein